MYDLSSMAPGFEVDYSDVFWYAWTSDVCEGWASDAFPKKPGDSVGYDTKGTTVGTKRRKPRLWSIGAWTIARGAGWGFSGSMTGTTPDTAFRFTSRSDWSRSLDWPSHHRAANFGQVTAKPSSARAIAHERPNDDIRIGK